MRGENHRGLLACTGAVVVLMVASSCLDPEDPGYLVPPRAGLQAGVAIRRRVSLYAGAGFTHSPGELGIVVFLDVGLLPFFGRVGAAVGFYRRDRFAAVAARTVRA